MKFVCLLFLFGLAAASFQERWQRERDDVIFHFMKGMKMAGPLRVALGMPDVRELDLAEEDVKTELGKKLQEHLGNLLEKLKDMLDKKEEVKQKFLDRVREIREKLKELHVHISEKTKELFEKVKAKLGDYIKNLIDKIANNEKRSLILAAEEVKDDFSLKEILKKIRDKIREHIDIDKIKEFIEKYKTKLGEFGELLKEKLKNREAVKALRDIIRKLLEGDDDRDTRSVHEKWEKLKEIAEKIHEKFHEKFIHVYKWLRQAIKNGLETAQDRVTALKQIARELIDRSKNVTKEIAVEALDILRPAKKELGDLWKQVKEKLHEIIHRKD